MTPDAEPRTDLVSALAYAFARTNVPGPMETGREYAERLVPLMVESGYLAEAATPADSLDAAWAREQMRQVHAQHDLGHDLGAWPRACALCQAARVIFDVKPPDGTVWNVRAQLHDGRWSAVATAHSPGRQGFGEGDTYVEAIDAAIAGSSKPPEPPTGFLPGMKVGTGGNVLTPADFRGSSKPPGGPIGPDGEWDPRVDSGGRHADHPRFGTDLLGGKPR